MNSTLLATVSDKNSNEYDIQREKDFLEKSYAFKKKTNAHFSNSYPFMKVLV